MTTGLITQPRETQTPQLKQLEAQIEAAVPAPLKDDFLRVLVAGQKAMYADETHTYTTDYLNQVLQAPPEKQPVLLAHGVLKLLTILYKESQGKMKLEAAFPACALFLCYALEMLGTRITVTDDLIAQSMKALAAGFYHAVGIDQAKMTQAVQAGMAKQQGSQPTEAPPVQTEPVVAKGGA